MENKTGPAMMPSTPTTGAAVLASLKRNVLWGVLGLVALVFATVCVMYYTSRQTEAAAPADATASTAITAATEMPPATGTDTPAGSALTPATTPGAATPAATAPMTPAPDATTATATTAATTPPTATGAIDKTAAAKPGDKTTGKPAEKVSAKATEKAIGKTAEKLSAKPSDKTEKMDKNAPAKTLDAANLPHGTKIYVVKAGDTMAKIAREVYGDGHRWNKIVEMNKDWLKDVNHLKVGQKLLVERTPNPRDYADY